MEHILEVDNMLFRLSDADFQEFLFRFGECELVDVYVDKLLNISKRTEVIEHE